MQDKNDDVALLQIPDKWFDFCSKVFIIIMIGFTAIALLDQFVFKMKFAQDFFDNKWLHRGSILMTLIVGYTFIIARLRHGITLKDSNRSYKEGRKEERESLKDWIAQQQGTNLSKAEILGKLEEEDDDP